MVKISDKGVDELLPEPRLFPEASAIAFSEALKNIENVPPQKSPLISPAVIGALSGSAHIFQPQAVFQLTFGQALLPTRIGATTTIMQMRPQSTATCHSAWSGPSGGRGGGRSGGRPGGRPGGGGGGPGGGPIVGAGHGMGGGGSNGGMKGNPPTIFSGDQSKSDDFLREFKIYQMANSQNNSMLILLDWIELAISFI